MKHEQDSVRQLKIQNEALKKSDSQKLENRIHPKIIQKQENEHSKEKEIFHANPPAAAAIKEENHSSGSKYEFGKVVKIPQEKYDHTRGTPTDPVLLERRDFVRNMMKHAWGGYKQKAWGYNEVQPKSGTPSTSNIFGKSKTGATIIDGLDTLWIMGLEEEFYDGRRWVQESFNLRSKFFNGCTIMAWLVSTDIGRPLPVLVGPSFANFEWFWSVSASSGRFWPIFARFCRFWSVSVGPRKYKI